MSIFRTFGNGSSKPELTKGEAVIGEMNFAFVDMGQGDCTIISDPDNNVYVIDCGSIDRMPESSISKAQKVLRKWAAGKSIEIIITHPDRDHYNKFKRLLTGVKPVVNVINIFFSRALSDTSPLGNYTQDKFSSSIHLFGNPDLVEITLNQYEDKVKIWQEDTNYSVPSEEEVLGEHYEIAVGDTLGVPWSIKVIAGNVSSANVTPAEVSNTASLVTLVQFDNLKLLLTGDSTSETFGYLEDFHQNDIKNVTTFQIPHHGSESSMPKASFVDLVNPKSLLVSVGLLNTSFFLPKKTIIDVWLKSKSLNPGDLLVVDYWVSGNDTYNTYQLLQHIKNVVWKNYKFVATKSKTFCWLLNPDDAIGNTGFYGFSTSNYFIFRIKSDKDIWLTGVEGSSWDENWSTEN